MRKAPVVLVVLVMFGMSSVAFGKRPPKEFQYSGWHPVAKRYGGKFCYFDGPHAHPFRPSPRGKFKESAGRFVFLGDPTRFGFEGKQYSFDGPHPVPDAPELVCKTRGAHRHFFEPPRTPEYRDHGGVAFYEGLDLRKHAAKSGKPVAVSASAPSPISAPPPVAKAAPPPTVNKQVAQAPRKPAQTSGKAKDFMPREDDD